MHRLRAWLGDVRGRAHGFEPRGLPLSGGRTLLAVATFTVVAFTPDDALFAYTAEFPTGVDCTGLRGLSLWCVTGTTGHGPLAGRVLALAVLAVTAAGYRPRWTSVPHWFVTFSLASSMTLPNGGEKVAQILTLLLVPICLGDHRRWHWQRPVDPLPPTWRGVSWAAMLAVRTQVFVIYASAAVSKLRFPEWRDGTAMYSVFHDPGYGMPPGLMRLLDGAVDAPWLVALLTWATIATELGIAVSILGTRTTRAAAVLLACALHVGIVLTMGLVSFGTVMIGTVLVARAGTSYPRGPDGAWCRAGSPNRSAPREVGAP